MNAVAQELFSGMRGALAVWLTMVFLVVFLCAIVSVPTWSEHLRARRVRVARHALAYPATLSQQATTMAQVVETPATQAVELRRYAEEVAVAANHAQLTAERRHAEWAAVQRAQDAAWRAFEQASAAASRIEKAQVFPVRETAVPPEKLTGDEKAHRQRYLHRAASTAYHRGELSADQLTDALLHRNGWDPYRHPFEQEATIRRIARERLLSAYQAMSTMERSAWHAAEIAAAARASLHAEALAAALRAHRATSRLSESPRRHVAPAKHRRPLLATH
ncbi:MAG: hypothetical protein J2P15_12245 [Micromonosporaceae bacterium]|nr:hypothetical protein [Micromonosporaceae bacterium]